jgi:hypothetical protein
MRSFKIFKTIAESFPDKKAILKIEQDIYYPLSKYTIQNLVENKRQRKIVVDFLK